MASSALRCCRASRRVRGMIGIGAGGHKHITRCPRRRALPSRSRFAWLVCSLGVEPRNANTASMSSTTNQLEHLNSALAGRYVLSREIGHGGMATVYLGRDVKHQRDVALKVFRREVAAALGHDRFRREIELAANLSHPH